MNDLLPLDEPVVLAFLLGLFTAVVLLAAWYGIPALWWWWHDRRPEPIVDRLVREALEESDEDQALRLANQPRREATS